MGRYLDAIKNSEDREAGNHQNLQNPLMDGFVGFVGSSPTPIEKNILRNGRQENHAELIRLVRLCGERYSFTEAEHAEALVAALADPVGALTCFRGLEVEVVKPVILGDMAVETVVTCASCMHSRKPGGVSRYCSARPDLPPAYGERHPLRLLPDDGGAGCGQWVGDRRSKVATRLHAKVTHERLYARMVSVNGFCEMGR